MVTVSDKKTGVDDGAYQIVCYPSFPPIPSYCEVQKINYSPDGFIDFYTPDVITANDYYPFGMQMVGRKYSNGSGYRYGFNGKEKDKDIGTDDYDFGARIYDARIGKFFSTDPLEEEYENISPYAFAANNPIYYLDENGEFPKPSEILKKLGFEVNPYIGGFLDGLVDASPIGMVGFGWDLLTDDDFSTEVWNGLKALAADPIGTLKAMYGEKVDNWTAALNGTATEGQKYAVGNDVGVVVGTVLTGAGAKKFFKDLKVAGETAKATKAAEQAAQKTANAAKTVEKTAEKAKSGMCFVAGTVVLSSRGLVNIEDVKQGDTVWAYNTIKQKVEKRIVAEAIVKESKELIKLIAEQDILLTTPDHPFYINKNWVEARDIQVGDSLLLYNNNKIAVSFTEHKDTTVTVYNLSVYDLNSYYVGKQSFLVHNVGCKQPVKRAGKNGNPDHIAKVEELAKKAQKDYPGYTIEKGKQIKKHPGSTRQPDVQVLDKKGKTIHIYEAERRPGSKRNIKREAEYKKLKVKNETHKVGG